MRQGEHTPWRELRSSWRVFRCLSDNNGALIHDPATGACAALGAPEEVPIVKALPPATAAQAPRHCGGTWLRKGGM